MWRQLVKKRQYYNDTFSAFSNALLMNRCAGHQILVNFSN